MKNIYPQDTLTFAALIRQLHELVHSKTWVPERLLEQKVVRVDNAATERLVGAKLGDVVQRVGGALRRRSRHGTRAVGVEASVASGSDVHRCVVLALECDWLVGANHNVVTCTS